MTQLFFLKYPHGDQFDLLCPDIHLLQNDNDRLVKRNDALSAALSDLEVKHEQDLVVMRENANREIERLENELEQYRPSVSRGLRR